MTNAEHKLNIIVSRTETRIGGMIRKVIGGDYNHCSFYLDEDVRNVYGFSRRYREFWFTGCFTRENPIYYDEYKVYGLPLSDRQYEALRDRIVEMSAHIKVYNYLSALMLPAGVAVESDSSYICSTFVADLIDKYTELTPVRDVNLHGPMDVYELLEDGVCKGKASSVEVDLPREEDYSLTSPITRWHEEAKDLTGSEDEHDNERIICRGGDRQLSMCVSHVLGSGADIPIGLIPSGTTNDMARTIGIPAEEDEAEKIAAGNMVRAVDSADLDGENFICIAGFGDITRASHSTSATAKKIMGYAAYFLSGMQSFLRMRDYDVSITLDGKTLRGRYLMMLVTNSCRAGGIRLWDQISPDDGVFEVLLVKRTGPGDISETVEKYKARDITVVNHSSRPIEWILDGEPALTTPSTHSSKITVHPRSWRILVDR